MPRRIASALLLATLSIGHALSCHAQQYTTPAPDGKPGAVFGQGCVSSDFFDFSYQLPGGMSLQDMSNAPNGGKDTTQRNYVLFMAVRPHAGNGDVINAAAEDRRSATDQSAASWIRALHNWNAKRSDIPSQDNVEYLRIANRDAARLRFRQSRDDGVITYETAYAFAIRGYVVYFILASVDEKVLAEMEKSMDTLSAPNACQASK